MTNGVVDLQGEEKFFEDAAEMFATQGWKDFLSDINALAETCNIENLSTAEEFWMARGRVDAVRRVLGYQQTVKTTEYQRRAESDA